MSLFSPITYHLSTSLLPSVSSQLDTLLQMNGATRAVEGVYDKGLTHVVAESLKFEGWEQVVRRAEGGGEREGEGGDEGGQGQGDGGGGEGKDVHGRRVEVVTPMWVERSAVLGKLQPEQYFSADPSMLFSGICACSTDLPSSDLEVLSAGITALGGQWRISLTKEVTHLFALSPDSPKYSTAIHYKEETGMKVLLPHWFDDVVRLGMRGLSEGVYEWPEPRLLKGVDGFEPADKGKEKENVPAKEVQTEKDRVKRNMYATAHLFTQPMNQSFPPTEKDINLVLSTSASASATTDNNNNNNNNNKLPPPSSAPSNGNASILSAVGADGGAPGIQHQVWAGRKVLLSRTLQLYYGRHQAVRLNIERAGGVVLRYEGDDEEQEALGSAEGQGFNERLGRKEKARRRREAEVVEECDVLVTRWRYGRAYVQAVRQAKTIGTLAWLFHVQSTGIYSRPLDQLLHFPVPKRPIENFENHVVTVTNYTGEAREYLKKLIMAMGATFTPSMSGQNTALVAAYVHGTKATKALSWSIPVVNHTWLEDCFIQWRNLTPANIKYIHFPPGVDFSKILGERGVHSGGDLTLEGKGKEGVLVNGFKHDINMGGVGPSTREEVMGRIEAEAEELAEMGDDLSDVDAEDHEDLEHQAPNGTEASMKEVAGLVDVTIADVDREAPMDLDLEQSPEVSAAALAVFEHGDGLMDFKDQPPEVSEVEDGAEMEVEVEERVKSPVKPKSTSKLISPTKPKSKSVPVRESPTKPTSKPASSKSPSKPTVNGKISSSAKAKSKPKAISVSGGSSAEDERQPVSAQQVIELADSSEEEEERVKAKAKENVKQRMKPKMKPVVEMVVRSTPKGKEKEKENASASASKSKSKSAEKVNVRKGATPSEAEDAEAESPSPPVQTVSVRKKNKVTPKSTGKAKEKVKEKRSRMTSSSDEANRESDEGMEPPPPRQRKKPVHHEESDEEMKPPPPRQKPRKLVRHVQQDEDEDEDEEGTPPPPPPPRRKEKKQNLAKTTKKAGKRIEDEADDEDSVAVVPVKKASVSPAKPLSAATAMTSAGKGGLMNKAKGDARTRVKKKKNNEKEREVEVESKEEEEPKKKGRKAKEVGRKKGYKEVESEDDEEDDDVVIVSRKVEKKSTKKGQEESAEEEEEAPLPNKKSITKSSKPQPTAKSKSTSKSKGEDEPQQAKKGRSKPLRVYSDQDEEDEEEEEEAFPPPADSDDSDELPAAPLQKSKVEKRAEETKKGKGKEKVSTSKSKAELKTTTSAKSKGKRPATPTETEPDEEREEEPARKTKAATTIATKQGPTTPKRVMSVILPSLELSPEKAKAVKKAMQEVNAKAVEKKKQTETEKGKGKGKVKDKKAVSDDEEQEEEVEEPQLPKRKRGGSPKQDKEASTSVPPKSKAQSKSRTVTTSRRHPSSVESEDEEEEKEEVTAIVSPRAARALARTESVRAVAGQALAAAATPSKSAKAKKGAVNGAIVNATASTSRAVVASVTASTSLKPKPKAKSKREQGTPMEVDQSASVSVADDTSISVAPPRRSAAAKATQKLHDTIMPDLLQYEAQRKKAGKSASSHAFAMNGDEVDAEKGKKKRASQEEEDGEVEKPKKRRRVSDADSGDEIQVISKPSTSKGKGKQKVNEDDAMDVDNDGKGLPGEGIFIMTTQVSLRDDVVKVLNKLGVKMTTRPNECTHLITSNLVRTEKFLCALASRAPWIITERWAVESAEAKKILPEKDFVLKDKAGENRYGVVLTESLRRSKALAGKLLAGHTFYVTPRVPVDVKLLKNVLTACGGQLTTQTPTVRIINAAPTTRHVISCKEDIATWRPLAAQGIKIYTQELVLTGALAQEMQWDREDFLVPN